MSIGSQQKVGFLALNRFGFGARGRPNAGDLERAGSDPRGFLRAELRQPGIAELGGPTLQDSKSALKMLFAQQEQRRQERRAAAQAMAAGQQAAVEGNKPLSAGAAATPTAPSATAIAPAASPDAQAKTKAAEPPVQQRLFRAEALARFERAVHAEAGYVERLVHFWSNHFCVSAAKGGVVRATAGSFEREAIRPHVLGRFADMLRAVESHPAMLFYLDNAQSFGPNSPAGQRNKRGLNENLAREILELHTLGVHGGYTQADVTSLARIITGWTFAGRAGRIGDPGSFTFFAGAHEPGADVLIGKSYGPGGIEQGEAALADLARHPATARHIAYKLARHFVADDPPQSLTDRLAQRFQGTDGDLKALAITLIESDEAWSEPRVKMRNPEEFLMAALRAVERMPEHPGAILGPLNLMGMPLWQPPGPNGWPDTVATWASPEGMKVRLDTAAAIAARVKDVMDPAELLEAVAGPVASLETRQAIQRAESREQGVALLMMTPEFQWR
jgi:uncharacterized protein (DUF1800 family)